MVCKVFDSPEAVGIAAATMIAAKLIQKPNAVIGLATGGSPLNTYRHLVRMTSEGLIDWRQVTTFNLDEYIGLQGEHPQSFRTFMAENLFSKINIRPEAIHIPNGMNPDLTRESSDYDQVIAAAGGIDLQLLGIGRNGHIGFNEPAGVFTLGTHVVTLTEDTIDFYAHYFGNSRDVPRQALTMGIGTIMQARSIVLIATGSGKAAAIRDLTSDRIDPRIPGSILQIHPDVTILLDREAAGK